MSDPTGLISQKSGEGEMGNKSDVDVYVKTKRPACMALATGPSARLPRAEAKRRRFELNVRRRPRAHRRVVACISPIASISAVTTTLTASGTTSPRVGEILI